MEYKNSNCTRIVAICKKWYLKNFCKGDKIFFYGVQMLYWGNQNRGVIFIYSNFLISFFCNQHELKQEALSIKRQRLTDCFSTSSSTLPSNLQLSLKLAGEKGASSWLSTLPLECHGFALHKGDFCDAVALRYGWTPQNLPSNCVCGRSNTVEHALSCPNGAFPTIRHNGIRDLTAELMSEVCHHVTTEPSLQPLNEESLSLCTSNRDTGARLDIKASGF